MLIFLITAALPNAQVGGSLVSSLDPALCARTRQSVAALLRSGAGQPLRMRFAGDFPKVGLLTQYPLSKQPQHTDLPITIKLRHDHHHPARTVTGWKITKAISVLRNLRSVY